MIDRFESGQYTFEGGHIYFNNDVIKIRYDLLDDNGPAHMHETEVFD
jgi:hypothetical protein